MNRVAVGIIKKDDKYLLVRATKDFGEYTGSYYPPGGHIEDSESIEVGLKREIREELNVDIEPVKEIAITPGDVVDQMTYWWQCEIKGGELKIDDTEIADANYFSEKEIRQLKLWPATKKFFEKYIFTN